MKSSLKLVLAVCVLIVILGVFAYTDSHVAVDDEANDFSCLRQSNAVDGARGVEVSSSLVITDIIIEYLDTHLKIEYPFPQDQGLESVVGHLFSTNKPSFSHPPKAKWRIEILWRSSTDEEGLLVVYALHDLRLVDIGGPSEQIEQLQIWVESELRGEGKN